MFIKYQKVRNSFLGALAATAACVGAFFGLKGSDTPEPRPNHSTAQVAEHNLSKNESRSTETLIDPSTRPRTNHASNPTRTNQPNRDLAVSKLSESGSSDSAWTKSPNTNQSTPQGKSRKSNRQSDQARYIAAMKAAYRRADSSGKGKDVLGAKSRWKLNLYDDDGDGQYDRGKLDKNRDEIDDEKWNFKNDRWEKANGKLVWSVDRWVAPDSLASAQTSQAHASQIRYRTAMRIASAKANPTGKGKDVLGDASPWKLNLYDDDQDGTWDRAKLDINRDEIDDEKWTFKNGRWEKEGGALVWQNDQWRKAADIAKTNGASISNSTRYQAAFRIVAKGSNRSEQGKDVLGASSHWKLNLYDDV